MSIRDDILRILRAELGEGHEADTLATASKEFIVRTLRPKLIALYKRRIDKSSILAAREAMERRLADEEEQYKAIEDAVPPQVDKDLQGF